MAEMQDYTFATRMRDTIGRVAEGVVNRMRPEDKFATVAATDNANGYAYVTYPGETVAVPVACGHFIVVAGQRVRISGPASDRHISEVMDGWVVWSAWDLFFDIAGYVSGNALRHFEYRLDGDLCEYYFTYKVGTTSSFPAHYIRPQLPYPIRAGVGQRISVGTAAAVDVSTGLSVMGDIVMYSSDIGGGYFFGVKSYNSTAAGSTHNYWNQFSPPWPFRSGLDAAEAWAINDEITGAGRYRIAT